MSPTYKLLVYEYIAIDRLPLFIQEHSLIVIDEIVDNFSTGVGDVINVVSSEKRKTETQTLITEASNEDYILHEHLSPTEQISLLESPRKLKYSTTSSQSSLSSNQMSLLDELSSLIEIETSEATNFDFSLDRLDRINHTKPSGE